MHGDRRHNPGPSGRELVLQSESQRSLLHEVTRNNYPPSQGSYRGDCHGLVFWMKEDKSPFEDRQVFNGKAGWGESPDCRL